MKKIYVIVIIGFIILIAAVSNPSLEQHREVLKDKLNLHMQSAMNEKLSGSNNVLEQAGKVLGSMFGNTLIDGIINNIVSSDNYLIFSTTKITVEGKSKVIGIGIFGNVFITKKLDEAIEDGLLNK